MIKLHHVGIVVKDINEGIKNYKDVYGFAQESEIVYDEIQKVNVVFFSTNTSEVQIELISPAAEDSPVSNFLKKGGGLYHLCYQSDNFDEDIGHFKKNGAKVLSKPVEARAFKKKIVFLYFKRDIIEIVEK
ncbi:MAG: VOC family protein [Candidatus Lokiarchaeota archaeon]|nr:VOC family protein [Candidatus Lokiarchaeota archaeon]